MKVDWPTGKPPKFPDGHPGPGDGGGGCVVVMVVVVVMEAVVVMEGVVW